jgi:hypothetical protein
MAYKVFFCVVPENQQSSTTWPENQGFLSRSTGHGSVPAGLAGSQAR